jgi:hypothetical protein
MNLIRNLPKERHKAMKKMRKSRSRRISKYWKRNMARRARNARARTRLYWTTKIWLLNESDIVDERLRVRYIVMPFKYSLILFTYIGFL